MGYAAGQYYKAYCGTYRGDSDTDLTGTCSCAGPEAKWYTSPSYNGQICKRRSGWFCDVNIKEGYWDSLDSKCVVCSGPVETGYFDCNGDYSGDYKCESACGANPTCDEKYPDNMYDTDSDVYFDLYCDSNCYAYKCDASTECSSVVYYGSTYKCSYNYFYSTSSPRYDWLTSPYEGYPWQSCFDNHDNDCDGYKDCADQDCKGVKNQNTGVICCQSDSDCPSYNSTNHLKMYCDTNTHTCQTIRSCADNTECEDKWCCDKDSSLPSSCRLSGSCVAKGTLMCNNQYICDPPEGFVSSSSENTNIQVSKKLTLLDLLIHPFSYFFKR